MQKRKVSLKKEIRKKESIKSVKTKEKSNKIKLKNFLIHMFIKGKRKV